MKKVFLVSLITILTFSCSSPLDNKYSEETFMLDLIEIKKSGELSDVDTKMIAGWIMRSKIKKHTLDGKSYNQIIIEAKDYKKEQELLAEKAKLEEEQKKLEEEEKRQRLSLALTVAMYEKGFKEYQYKKYLTYSFAFENKTDREIRAFTGSVSINDLFDKEIKSINLTIDDNIKAGETFKATYTTDYNQFISEDVKLKSKDMDDLKVIWTPEKILFVDGTEME
tara:strand:+ start:664 stop:1335 length:672 start_codon:yes stop_codon:yes gene_type:complete